MEKFLQIINKIEKMRFEDIYESVQNNDSVKKENLELNQKIKIGKKIQLLFSEFNSLIMENGGHILKEFLNPNIATEIDLTSSELPDSKLPVSDKKEKIINKVCIIYEIKR